MGGACSTESKEVIQVQPSGRNRVTPVSEATQASQPAEDAARLRQQLQQEKEEHARNLDAAAVVERKRLDEAAAAERKRLNSEAAAERKRLDDDAAAQRAKLDEEGAAERKRMAAAATAEADADRKRLDEEAAAARLQMDEQASAQRKRLDEEATLVRQELDDHAAAERRRLEEEAAARRKQLEDEAAMVQRQLDEQATAQRQRLDDEAAMERRRLDDEAAARRKQLDDDATTVRQQLDEQAAARRKHLDDEAAAERRRLDGIVAALQQQLQSLATGLTAAAAAAAGSAASAAMTASIATTITAPRNLVAASEAAEVVTTSVQPAAATGMTQAASVPAPSPAAATAAAADVERQREQETAAAAAAVAAAAAATAKWVMDPAEATAAAERRKAEEEIEGTWTDQDLLASMPAGGIGLEQLPAVITDLHDGMPAPLRQAPMRLLYIDAVLEWANIRVYEEVDMAHEAIEVPYDDVDAATWDATLILSWRWSAVKPLQHVPGFAPMSDLQFAELAAVLRRARADGAGGLRFVWIDWCCVPQYSAPSMVEVLRSKLFYARARAMTVVPTFVTLPGEGIVRLLLIKAARCLRANAAGGSPRSSLALKLLESILDRNRIAGREYFTRVWTLAERMARFGRHEQLRHWLSLESWLGMLVDAMLRATEDPSASAVYEALLGRVGGAMLRGAILGPLQAALQTGSMHVSEGLEERVAELFELAVGIWHTSKELSEAPTRDWLVSYLLDAHSGMYAAWSDADRVWAVYSYFCWKQLDQRSQASLLEALQDLVRVAGGSRRLAMCMATKLGLARSLPPAEADKQGVAAAEANDGAALAAALEAGAFPDCVGTDGAAPLYFASKCGNLEAVKMLIKCGASVDSVNVHGASALHAASLGGHVEVAAALLAAGANVDLARQDGRTPLHMAAEGGADLVVRLLIKQGANMEAKDNEGKTPLYLAVTLSNKPDVPRVLLEAGANKDCKSKAGFGLLHGAAARGDEDIVQILLHAGLDPNVVTPDKEKLLTPLVYAAEKGHAGVIRALAKAGAKLDASGSLGTALHRACACGQAEAARALLQAGANKEARQPGEGDNRTPLMTACIGDKPAVAKVLLEFKASISATDKDGWQPIHYAAKADSYECVKLLKAAGASTKVQTKAGNYPKDLAKTSRVQGLLPDGRGLLEAGGNALLKALF